MDSSNKVRIGNTSITSIGGQVGWSTYSDARIKNKVKENVKGLEFINLLRPVTYHYDINKENELLGVTGTDNAEGKAAIEKIPFTGFLAQEVDAAAQKANYDFSGVDKNGTILALRYAEFVVPLVKAVQELNAKAEAQQKLIDALLNAKPANPATETGSDQRQEQSIVLTGMNNAYLGQNSPNPFSDETSIDYYIPESLFCDNGSCHIIFYDHLGRTIQETTVLKSGYGKINVGTRNLVDGVFTYKLLVNGEVIDVKKMVFHK